MAEQRQVMERNEASDGCCLWSPLWRVGKHLDFGFSGLPSWAVSYVGISSLKFFNRSVRWLLSSLFSR